VLLTYIHFKFKVYLERNQRCCTKVRNRLLLDSTLLFHTIKKLGRRHHTLAQCRCIPRVVRRF